MAVERALYDVESIALTCPNPSCHEGLYQERNGGSSWLYEDKDREGKSWGEITTCFHCGTKVRLPKWPRGRG